MPLYRYYPIPGDRMGFLWCATQISGLGILEFGPRVQQILLHGIWAKMLQSIPPTSTTIF